MRDLDAEYSSAVRELLPRLRRLGYLLSGDWHRADDLVQATIERLLMIFTRGAPLADSGRAGAEPASGPGGAKAYWLTERSPYGDFGASATPNSDPWTARECPLPQMGVVAPAAALGRAPAWQPRTSLCWEYAPGGWATLTLPASGVGGDQRAVAMRIAKGVRLGLHERVKVPFRFAFPGLVFRPIGVGVGSGGNSPVDGRPLPWSVTLALLDPRPPHSSRSLERAPVITLEPHDPTAVSTLVKRPNTTIDGHAAYQEQIQNDPGDKLKGGLTVFDVRGFDVEIGTDGYLKEEQVQLFHAITVLGMDRGGWTGRPLG